MVEEKLKSIDAREIYLPEKPHLLVYLGKEYSYGSNRNPVPIFDIDIPLPLGENVMETKTISVGNHTFRLSVRVDWGVEARIRERAKIHDEWERREYERLKAKFGGLKCKNAQDEI